MEIEEVPIDKIIEYENNPRMNAKAIEPLVKSIREFGFRVPILLDINNVIIAGHTRLKAAKQLRMANIPCIRITDLDNDKIKALRIVDNSTASLSDWDEIKLLTEISGIDIDLDGYGIPDVKESMKECKLSDRSMIPVMSAFFYVRVNINDAADVAEALNKLSKKMEIKYAQSTD